MIGLQEHREETWGVRINTQRYANRRSPQLPQGSLPWMTLAQANNWTRRGLVVWDNISQQVHHLPVEEAVKLLDQLRADDGWRAAGIPIMRTITTIRFPEQQRPKRARKQAAEPPKVEASEPMRETVVQELFRLSGDPASSFYAFLEANASLLHRMSDEDEKERTAVLSRVYDMIFGWIRKEDIQKFDLATRSFPWQRSNDDRTLVRDQSPNRATVQPTSGNWSWEGVIEQPDRFKHESPHFLKVDQAVAWCEVGLTRIADEARAQADVIQEPEPTFVPGPHLNAFRIDPAALEPVRSTYRVIIDLEYEPFDYKTWEISFGAKRRYEERYYTPHALAQELRLDLHHMNIEQLLGPMSGWYRIRSLATYYYNDVAMGQAQKLWDISAIHQRYKEQKLMRARYGIEEVETGYCTWLGGLEDAEHPWVYERSRAEYLADRAMRLTLIHALDVDGFRAYLELNLKHMSNDDLLRSMHKQRAASPYLPDVVRAESKAWLEAHPIKERRR